MKAEAAHDDRPDRVVRLSFVAVVQADEPAARRAAVLAEQADRAVLLVGMQWLQGQVAAIEFERASPQTPHCSRRFLPSSFLPALELWYHS